jgi:hypothetical protein
MNQTKEGDIAGRKKKKHALQKKKPHHFSLSVL